MIIHVKHKIQTDTHTYKALVSHLMVKNLIAWVDEKITLVSRTKIYMCVVCLKHYSNLFNIKINFTRFTNVHCIMYTVQTTDYHRVVSKTLNQIKSNQMGTYTIDWLVCSGLSCRWFFSCPSFCVQSSLKL